MSLVITLHDGNIGIIKINNPPLNLSTREVKDEIRLAMTAMEKDAAVSVILFTAQGSRAFSVGSDIKELQRAILENRVRERAEHENELNNYLAKSRKLTIAVIDGYALGGGLELALACDLRVCSRTAKLGVPEIKLGLFPGGGGSERLPRLLGYSKALELMVTGDIIDAEEALRIGLVNRVVDENVYEASLELARHIASFSPAAIQRIKKIAQRSLELPFHQANQLAIQDSVEAFLSRHGQEGIKAFLEKRSPNFTTE